MVAGLQHLSAKASTDEMSKDDRIIAIRLASSLVLMDEVELDTTLGGNAYNRPMTVFCQEYGYLRQVVRMGVPKDEKTLLMQGQMGMAWYSQVMGITERGKPRMGWRVRRGGRGGSESQTKICAPCSPERGEFVHAPRSGWHGLFVKELDVRKERIGVIMWPGLMGGGVGVGMRSST